MGILIDTRAVKRSTVGKAQFVALQRHQQVKLDESRAREASIQFRIGGITLIRTTDVQTPIRMITFYIVFTDVLFLLCLDDIDRLKVRFDNLENVLI